MVNRVPGRGGLEIPCLYENAPCKNIPWKIDNDHRKYTDSRFDRRFRLPYCVRFDHRFLIHPNECRSKKKIYKPPSATRKSLKNVVSYYSVGNIIIFNHVRRDCNHIIRSRRPSSPPKYMFMHPATPLPKVPRGCKSNKRLTGRIMFTNTLLIGTHDIITITCRLSTCVVSPVFKAVRVLKSNKLVGENQTQSSGNSS